MAQFRIIATAGLFMAATTGLASAIGPIEVIYTKIPTDPSSVIPGALDLAGEPVVTNFRSIEDLVGSPDGSTWLVEGRTQQGSLAELILIMGTGASGDAFAQEGQPIPGGAPGEVFDFFGSGLGRFNENNEFAYSARARGGVAAVFQKVIYWKSSGESFIVRQMGDPWMGLEDLAPNPSGDELIGNSVGSIHILNNGMIGGHDTTIQNIHSSRRPAIFYDDQMFHQINVTSVTGLDGKSQQVWAALDSNNFYTTPDGQHWYTSGRITGQPTTSDAVLVVDGNVMLQEGSPIGDTDVIVTAFFNTVLLANGDWLSRGDQPDDTDWAVRNGELLAATGDPVPTAVAGPTESLGPVFLAFTGNNNGDWVLMANTDNPDTAADTVIIYNGTQVVLREGDPVDLDGNGEFDDDVFIGRGNTTLTAFRADTVVLTDDRILYLIASIHNSAGVDYQSDPSFGTPDAFLRIDLNEPVDCPPDLNGDTFVDGLDLGILLANWSIPAGTPGCGGALPCPSDLNGDTFVDGLDLGILLANWSIPAGTPGCS